MAVKSKRGKKYVKPTKAFKEDFWSKVKIGKKKACWLWTGQQDHDGYGMHHFPAVYVDTKEETFKTCKASRVARMLDTKVLVDDPKVHTRHSCHVRLCCNPAHLSEGSAQDNADDKVAAGRQARGETMHTAKLTEKDVQAILSSPKTYEYLALKYGVDRSIISKIKTRKIWSHVVPIGLIVTARKGAVGSAHSQSKLNDKIVRKIRASKEISRVLAAKYGVSRAQIDNVKSGKSWGHVQ